MLLLSTGHGCRQHRACAACCITPYLMAMLMASEGLQSISAASTAVPTTRWTHILAWYVLPTRAVTMTLVTCGHGASFAAWWIERCRASVRKVQQVITSDHKIEVLQSDMLQRLLCREKQATDSQAQLHCACSSSLVQVSNSRVGALCLNCDDTGQHTL